MPKIEIKKCGEYFNKPKDSQIITLNQEMIDNGINEYETRANIRLIFARYVAVRSKLAWLRYDQANAESERERTRAYNQVLIHFALAEEYEDLARNVWGLEFALIYAEDTL